MNAVRFLSSAMLIAVLDTGIGAHVVAQTTPSPGVTDPLALELQHCKDIGERAASDARCQAAYKQSRDQFLAPSKPYEPHKVDIFPTTGNESKRFEPKMPNGNPTGVKQ